MAEELCPLARLNKGLGFGVCSTCKEPQKAWGKKRMPPLRDSGWKTRTTEKARGFRILYTLRDLEDKHTLTVANLHLTTQILSQGVVEGSPSRSPENAVKLPGLAELRWV